MASDGFQDIPGSYSQGHTAPVNPNESMSPSYPPPYPSHYGPDRVPMPQPQVPRTSTPTSHYPEPPPNPSAWQSQPQHYPGGINEAVHSAFHQNDSPAYLSPDVLNRITENVIQQLKSTNLGTQPPPAEPAPLPQWAQVPQNPYPSEYATPPPGVSQNPSPIPPDIYRERPDYPPAPSSGYSGSPRPYPRPPSVSPAEHRESPVSQASERGQRVEPRPRPPSREETITEMTTLEKIWGKFFEEGKPTERLGQFLRGIAAHLIEDYAPENSLVVVPEKMQKFYEDTQIPADPYPWQDIFDDRTSAISRLYRDAEAEHHLVQQKLKERPDIPGLTPRGFQRWVTLQIRAHPDREYERLQKAVRHMPISNPDDRKERFPKEIPRRLFPDAPDLVLREELDQCIMKQCGLQLPSITDEEIREATVRRHKMSTSSTTSTRESVPRFSERERQSRYQPAVEDDDDEENEIIPPQQIERERKPYTAHPGGGKVYDENAAPPMSRHANTSSTGSIPRNSPVPANRGSDSYGAAPSHHRSGSSTMSRSATGRSLSPLRGSHPTSDYRHSESDLFSSSSNGGSRYPATSSAEHYYTSASPNLSGDLDDSRRYRDLDRELEDQRLYDSIREREKERERAKYRDRNPKRSSWADGDDYYRGAQSSSPVGGVDYRTYTYK